MIIPLTIDSHSPHPKLPPGLAKISHDEVVLIELQGSLEVECNHISERDGKFVGKLKIDDTKSKATLLIGHHLLEGKFVDLPKPLAVIHRSNPRSPTRTDRSEERGDPEYGMGEGAPENDMEWRVEAIIKRKILFSKRPMPVVNVGAAK